MCRPDYCMLNNCGPDNYKSDIDGPDNQVKSDFKDTIINIFCCIRVTDMHVTYKITRKILSVKFL